jgi:PQQ-like domain
VTKLLLSIAAAAGLVASAAVTVPAASAAPRPASAAPHSLRSVITPNGAWTVYHHDNAHTGFDSTQAAAKGATAGWISPTLDEQVYGEPLVYNGLVYVSTLNNTVYALNQTDGTVVWSKNLGAPQTSGWQCGNVPSSGILGTGVIDTAKSRIYVVAFLTQFHSYYLYGLSLASGTIVQTSQILPVGFDWTIQQQRGALALSSDGTHVYVPFGGRYGDCGAYYGWVVGVPTAGGLPDELYQTPSTGSGIWAAGGVVVDNTTGNVFFATGNAIPCAGAINSDSVIGTNSTLGSPSFFQPLDWSANYCVPDMDLGSAAPVLVSPNLMFTAGKYGQGFLLNPKLLGGTNGQLFPASSPYVGADVCGGNHSDATFGSFAYSAPYVYLECDGRGLVALKVDATAPSFSLCDSTCGSPSWNAGGSTTFGPPIVAGGAVWVVDIGGSGLYGFDATTGAQIYQSAAFGVDHFTTPSEAGGQIFVSAGTEVRSFNMAVGCTALSATFAPPTSATVGTTVAVTGSATGCPNPNPLYQFWYLAPGSSTWTLGKAYSPSATFNWDTSGKAVGTYSFSIWARDAGSPGTFGDSLGRWDASTNSQYSLLSTACTGMSATVLPQSPAPSGTVVSIKGSGTGCFNPRYEFWLLAQGSSTWQDVRPYSATATFNWNTTDLPAGTYRFAVWVKDLNSAGTYGNSLGRWDSSANITYMLTVTRCTSASVTSSPPNTTTVGNPVTFTAGSTGCQFPLYEFWMLAPGSSTWKDVQAYGNTNKNIFTWTTTGLARGAYRFSVWARSSGSPGNYVNSLGRWDASFNLTYTLT